MWQRLERYTGWMQQLNELDQEQEEREWRLTEVTRQQDQPRPRLFRIVPVFDHTLSPPSPPAGVSQATIDGLPTYENTQEMAAARKEDTVTYYYTILHKVEFETR